MQNNKNIGRAMESSDVLTTNTYLKRVRREKRFRRIMSRAKTRKQEMKLIEETITRIIRNDTLNE